MTRPPENLDLQEEIDRFYRALGCSITQWQRVESALAFIFEKMVGRERTDIANIAFHSIQSFDGRLGMTHSAVMLFYTSGKEREIWTNLHNRASRRYDRRNYLAHFQMEVDESAKPGYRVHLRPNVYDIKAALRWLHPPRLNTCQIIATGNAFDRLADEMMQFYQSWVLPQFS